MVVKTSDDGSQCGPGCRTIRDFQLPRTLPGQEMYVATPAPPVHVTLFPTTLYKGENVHVTQPPLSHPKLVRSNQCGKIKLTKCKAAGG